MAFCFGTDPAIAAFLVAYRFASLLRRIFGEGALLNSFIPNFEHYRGEDPKKAACFFRDTFFSLSSILILLILIVEIGLYSSLQYGNLSEGNVEIIQLTMLMFPSLLFLCLYSLCSGLLQCEKSYFLAGAAPIGLNLVWIAAVWTFKDWKPEQAVIPLSISIVAACLVQWMATFPKTLKFLRRTLSWKEIFEAKLFSKEMRAMLGAISLGIVGVSAVQINNAIDTIFSRYASLEGPAYLNYAIHIQQLPLALFGIAVSSALLPPLSRSIKAGDLKKYSELLHYALTHTLFLLIPCSLAILALGGAGINLVYGHGDFSEAATLSTTLCLWGYGIGLVPMAMALLITPAFFSKKDFWTPTKGSLYSIALNFALNYLFVVSWGWGPASLAVSTSLAGLFNAVYLLKALQGDIGFNLTSSLLQSSWKTALASLTAACAIILVGYFYFEDPSLSILLGKTGGHFVRDFKEQFIQMISMFTIFTITFLASLKALKAHEVLNLIKV